MRHSTGISAVIQSVVHDPLSETLEVTFASGAAYRYAGVSPGVYDEFMTAASPMRYFQHCIKGRYGFERVGLGVAA